MNFRQRASLALAFALLVSACKTVGAVGPEREPAPTATNPYMPTAAAVCREFISTLYNQGKVNSGQIDPLTGECTEMLANTAAYHRKWPTGQEWDPGTHQWTSRARTTAISIAGQLGFWAKEANKLTELIEEANPDR